MTYKEFYYWLDGYLTNKLESEKLNIAPIIEKMGQVNDNDKIGIAEPYRIPIPVNPFPIKDDPYKPPYEVYCGDKTQLND
jgi:hypothetical protein